MKGTVTRHGRISLTREQVRRIKAAWKAGAFFKDLQRRFKISGERIRQIVGKRVTTPPQS
jgi:Mor family transcriptional regulator